MNRRVHSTRGRPPGASARYRQVADDLQRRLSAREWAAGVPLPSIRQLVAEYRTTLQVIRLALEVLKKSDWVVATPRGALLATPGRSPVSALHGAVVLVLGHSLRAQLQNRCYAALQRGIEDGVASLGAPLLLIHDAVRLKKVIPVDLPNLPLQGILLLGQFQKSVLARYARLRAPTVHVDQPPQVVGLSAVCADNFKAAYDATQRLLDEGHRRIAFLRFVQLHTRDIDPDSREREAGFRQALTDAGLGRANQNVFNTFSRDSTSHDVLRPLFEATPPFTAVLAVDPSRARLVEHAARRMNWTIPDDLSLVVFHAADGLSGGWTGPSVDFVSMGRLAVKMLAHAKKNGPTVKRVAPVWNHGNSFRRISAMVSPTRRSSS